ncbi:6233_t:CDS:2 [Diversispora eburnea]|uniref:6233_t:CDS:1 n=1 Tax=Diversispora eburnea TaxID=1213867 RepID=A0A9N9F7V8_9GLOM|nr:6233_t:CDS:2 [Diversispora eburnea]
MLRNRYGLKDSSSSEGLAPMTKEDKLRNHRDNCVDIDAFWNAVEACQTEQEELEITKAIFQRNISWHIGPIL